MKYEIQLDGRSYPVEVIAAAGGRYRVTVDDRAYEVDLTEPEPNIFSLLLDGRSYEVGVESDRDLFSLYLFDHFFQLRVLDPRRRALAAQGRLDLAEGLAEIRAPMPGKVVKFLVAQGDAVREGQGVVVVEAMKMENELSSPKAGVVKEILVQEGTAVTAAEVLAVVE